MTVSMIMKETKCVTTDIHREAQTQTVADGKCWIQLERRTIERYLRRICQ